jgi:hypothetical protein
LEGPGTGNTWPSFYAAPKLEVNQLGDHMYQGKRLMAPRPLPAELLQQGSDLFHTVKLAAEVSDTGIPGAESLVKKTRTLLHRSCPQYRRSHADGNGLLCGSGEQDGKPVRPECIGCIVGRFSANGFFVGTILPAGAEFSR